MGEKHGNDEMWCFHFSPQLWSTAWFSQPTAIAICDDTGGFLLIITGNITILYIYIYTHTYISTFKMVTSHFIVYISSKSSVPFARDIVLALRPKRSIPMTMRSPWCAVPPPWRRRKAPSPAKQQEFLVGGLEHEFYDFPFSWEMHNPNWRTHISSEG